MSRCHHPPGKREKFKFLKMGKAINQSKWNFMMISKMYKCWTFFIHPGLIHAYDEDITRQ